MGGGRILPKCSYENLLFGKMPSGQRSHIHFKGCWEDDFPLEDDAGYVSFSMRVGPVSKKYQKVAGLFSMESIVFAIDLVFMEVTD